MKGESTFIYHHVLLINYTNSFMPPPTPELHFYKRHMHAKNIWDVYAPTYHFDSLEMQKMVTLYGSLVGEIVR